jgi:hypothetical protein
MVDIPVCLGRLPINWVMYQGLGVILPTFLGRLPILEVSMPEVFGQTAKCNGDIAPFTFIDHPCCGMYPSMVLAEPGRLPMNWLVCVFWGNIVCSPWGMCLPLPFTTSYPMQRSGLGEECDILITFKVVHQTLSEKNSNDLDYL